MAAPIANQASTRGRRSAVPADSPILAAKITVPNVPGWAVRRPRITELIAQSTQWCPLLEAVQTEFACAGDRSAA